MESSNLIGSFQLTALLFIFRDKNWFSSHWPVTCIFPDPCLKGYPGSAEDRIMCILTPQHQLMSLWNVNIDTPLFSFFAIRNSYIYIYIYILVLSFHRLLLTLLEPQQEQLHTEVLYVSRLRAICPSM